VGGEWAEVKDEGGQGEAEEGAGDGHLDFIGRAAWDFLHLGCTANEEEGDFPDPAALAERDERVGEFVEGDTGKDENQNGEIPDDPFNAADRGRRDGDQNEQNKKRDMKADGNPHTVPIFNEAFIALLHYYFNKRLDLPADS